MKPFHRTAMTATAGWSMHCVYHCVFWERKSSLDRSDVDPDVDPPLSSHLPLTCTTFPPLLPSGCTYEGVEAVSLVSPDPPRLHPTRPTAVTCLPSVPWWSGAAAGWSPQSCCRLLWSLLSWESSVFLVLTLVLTSFLPPSVFNKGQYKTFSSDKNQQPKTVLFCAEISVQFQSA